MHRVAISMLMLVLMPLVADGQEKRRLQSRAAFAALDSTAVADSSAMIPLDPHERLDSLMLDMWSTLDDGGAIALGGPRSRIRKWNGFGSQAHPSLGILIDGDEVKALLESVRRYKGMVGVSREQITERAEWAVRFLVSHEYAHLVQYNFFGKDSVENPAATRVIECGADILGGYQYQVYLNVRAMSELVPESARDAARDFGYVIGANNWLDGTTHPLPENRRNCIGSGMSAGLAMGVLSYARLGTVDSLTNSLIKWLAENEPDLRFGRITAIEWSRVKARELAAIGSVVGENKELEIVRDTSVARIVLRLASAATKGEAELRKLRGPRLSRGGNDYLLREALSPPWQCSIATSRRFEEAECSYQLRTRRESADTLMAELVQQIRTAVKGTAWVEARSEINQDAPGELRKNFRRVFFTIGGAVPDDPEVIRVDVFLGDSLSDATSQLPAGYVIGFGVRAKR